MITADTITDEQIRELRDATTGTDRVTAYTCDIALGRFRNGARMGSSRNEEQQARPLRRDFESTRRVEVNFLDARLPARFWDKCSPEPMSGCWLWIGATDEHGYSRFRLIGTQQGHRLTFSVENEIDPLLVLDHKCRTPSCVNPAHLRQVTQERNAQLNYRSTRSQCAKGHPFDDTNTYRTPDGRGRKCRRCHADKQAARKLNARKVSP